MGGRRALVLVIALAAACNGGGGGGDDGGDDDAFVPIDARWGPVEYHGSITMPAAPLRTRIDGVFRSTVYYEYPDVPAYEAATIRFELLDGEEVIDSFDVDLSEQLEMDFGGQCRPGTLFYVDNSMCGYDHGEIRVSSVHLVHFEGAGCGPQPSCQWSRCPIACGSGLKCSAAFTSSELRYSRVQCVAAGARTDGETCTFQLGTDGRWSDDCADQLVCLQGTCRPQCRYGVVTDCGSSATCTRMPRAHEQIAGCVPN
jgi:hypothetical protein